MGCSDTKQESGGTQIDNDAGAGGGTGSWFDDQKKPTEDAGGSDSQPGADAGETTDKSPFKPLANVYEANPIDSPELSEVELTDITAEDYALKGLYANVRNCLPVLETGQKIPINQGGFSLNLTTCTPQHSAFPGDDGTYLHIVPPEDPGAGDDAFAEVMMYHHMQLIHGYYKGIHGLSDLDWPLDALVNLQVNVDLCNQWTSISNAAFVPGGALNQFGFNIDLGIDGDAIMFSGSTNKDFSYDADVIYHEYTHAMIGTTRLNAVFADNQGVNNTPGALNEAYADYFACTLTNESQVGNYALNNLDPLTICGFPLGGGGGNMARDLSKFRKCPDDLTAEVHADGEIFGSALWAIREALGAEKADKVILDALVGFSNATGFIAAATFTIDSAQELLSADDAAAVEKAFADRGLTDCERVVPSGNVGTKGIPLSVLAANSLNPNPFGDYIPGYNQFWAQAGPETQTLTIEVHTTGGGGFGGGGQAAPSFDVVFKPGPGAIKYAFPQPGTTGKITTDAVVTVPATSGGNN